MNGFLLAAGLGTRFRPHTDKLSKPAIPLLNVPLAFYNLHLIQQMGLNRVVLNTHHLPHTVKKLFNTYPNIDVEITFSDEEETILGTGGAIKRARKELEGSGTFCMANADVVNVFSLRDVLAFHHGHHPLATMVVMKHPQAGKKYGAVWVNSKKEVVGIGKEKPADIECEPFHFIGIHFIEESIFKYIPDGPCDINKDVYLKAIAEGETVLAFEKSGLWYDAGNLKDYLEATEDLLRLLPRLQHQPFFLSLYRRFWPNFDKRPNIWEGENCEHFLDLGANSMILMDRNCKIHQTCKVDGFAVFGQNAIVEKDVELQNVVVGPGVVVKAGVYKNSLLL
jgi:mannose-1-phosphate guanylyltransferase